MLSESEKRSIDLLDKLERLKYNQDFKFVFINYFCKEYALEIMGELNQFSINSESYKEKIRQLDSISMFNKFLTDIENEGQIAKDNERYLSKIPNEEI